jgi:uncharacterized membrane protein YfhO
MGIFVPHGRHRVDLTYAPDSYRVGLYISLFATLICCLGSGFVLVARRDREEVEKR